MKDPNIEYLNFKICLCKATLLIKSDKRTVTRSLNPFSYSFHNVPLTVNGAHQN